MRQRKDAENWHAGPRIDAIPVVGIGGLIFAIGMVGIFLVGLPIAKWFLIASVIVGVGIFGAIRLVHKAHPATEEEEVQLDIGLPNRRP